MTEADLASEALDDGSPQSPEYELVILNEYNFFSVWKLHWHLNGQ
jgi:hypothetical protein